MTRPALLAALLAAAPALAQPAPPTAADTALVERYLALSAEGLRASAPTFADAPGPLGSVMGTLGGAGLDSTRAVFYRDLRPALLAEALAFMEGPEFERAQRESTLAADSLSFAEMQALLDDPGDRPLADSALAARYAAALLAATQPPDVQERTLDLLIPAFPADLLDAAGGADAFRELYRSQMQSPEVRALQLDAMTRAGRLSLAGLDEADVRAITAFYESDAGRYASRAAALGAANALAPRMAEVMASALAAQSLAPDAPSGGAAPPDGDVYEVAEVMPEIIGGLAALQARVVYPEAARRAGVEGQVVVQFVVDEGGAVTDLDVLRSPNDLLAEAALKAVRESTFKPGQQRGRPVKVRFAVPVTFRLTPFDPDALIEEVDWSDDRTPPPPPPPTRPSADGVYEVAEVQPELVGGLDSLQARLVYPEAARLAGAEGTVVVRFVVDAGGAVTDLEVLRSPSAALSEAALDAVRRSSFTPGRVGGAPVRVRLALPARFTLTEGGAGDGR